MDDESPREKRARVFERHSRAAREGVHLPSFVELLRGMEMFNSCLRDDVSEFATRMLLRLKRQKLMDTPLGTALRILSVSPEIPDLLTAANAFSEHLESSKLAGYLQDGRRRCDYYAACKGDRDAMLRVARYAIVETQRYAVGEEITLELSYAALGWLSLSARPSYHSANGHQDAQTIGSSAVNRMQQEQKRQDEALSAEALHEIANSDKQNSAAKDTAEANPSSVAPDMASLSAVIVEAIGNADLHEGREVHREFKSVVGASLPLCAVKDLSGVQQTLNREFPHASAITQEIVARLAERNYIHLRPVLLVGPPGCGKTSYAQRLLQTLGVPGETFPCGGTTDSAFQGTGRRWTTGEPSVPMSLVRRYMIASPGIILDELEKASASRHNGSLFDCLLGLMETESASSWRDPYIQAHVNLSYVVWLATANSLSGIPPTLLDRMSSMEFPVPNQSHLPILANGILRRSLVSRGYDERWALPLDGEELDALSRAWPGGSIRQLQRLIKVVIDVRGSGLTRQ